MSDGFAIKNNTDSYGFLKGRYPGHETEYINLKCDSEPNADGEMFKEVFPITWKYIRSVIRNTYLFRRNKNEFTYYVCNGLYGWRYIVSLVWRKITFNSYSTIDTKPPVNHNK